MNVYHIATIAAYPIKAELGGGFRGVYKPIGGERVASEVLATLEEARFWAQNEAYSRHAEHAGYSLAALRRKDEYQANVWVGVE